MGPSFAQTIGPGRTGNDRRLLIEDGFHRQRQGARLQISARRGDQAAMSATTDHLGAGPGVVTGDTR
jgi:hypothetical protein